MLRTILTLALVLPAAAGLAEPALAAAAAAPRCHGMPATIVGTPGDDDLGGTPDADVIVGLGGDDRILGAGGGDLVCGGAGSDRLDGGRGDDELYGGRDRRERHGRRTFVAGDLLEGGPGDDTLSVGFEDRIPRVRVERPNRVSYRHSARPISLDLRAGVATGEGSDVVVAGRRLVVGGSRYGDQLLGSSMSEALDGWRGPDVVSGRGGRDEVVGSHGIDDVQGGDGRDFVLSLGGAGTAAGGAGADFVVAASARPTTLLGGPGRDFLYRQVTPGETGTIDGGAGENHLNLMPQLWFDSDVEGNLDAAAGTALLTDGERTQTTTFSRVQGFTLETVPWEFRGTAGDDFVQVFEGRLDAQGLGGDDFMVGYRFRDILDGGEGTDAGWGGRGRNTCIDTEKGDCDGYPWDLRPTTRARVVGHDLSSLARTSPRRLLSRWQDHRTPFTGR